MSYESTARNPETARLAVDVLGFQAVERNTLQGFAKVRLRDIGLIVEDVAIHTRDGRRWAQLPSKPCLDRDRRLMLEPTGKPRYVRVIHFEGRDQADAFSAAVLAGVDAIQRGGVQ